MNKTYFNVVTSLVALTAFSPAFAGQTPTEAMREKMKLMGVKIPAVIAHRGADWYAPEESLPSFLLAMEMGADYLEMDAHLTKDGVIILNHDDTFERTTNIKSVFPGREKEPIYNFTWAEVQKLDNGSSFNLRDNLKSLSHHVPRASFVGQKVLRLEQVLKIARSKPGYEPGIYIEAKVPTAEKETELASDKVSVKTAEAIVKVLSQHGWIDNKKTDNGKRVIFESFGKTAVERFHKRAPTTPVCFLFSFLKDEKAMDQVIEATLDAGAQITGPFLFPHQYKYFTERAHEKGLMVHPWIVDEVDVLGGAFNLISAEWLIEHETSTGKINDADDVHAILEESLKSNPKVSLILTAIYKEINKLPFQKMLPKLKDFADKFLTKEEKALSTFLNGDADGIFTDQPDLGVAILESHSNLAPASNLSRAAILEAQFKAVEAKMLSDKQLKSLLNVTAKLKGDESFRIKRDN